MDKTIEIGKIGKILKGDNKNYYIKIKEDFESTGGYLILLSKDPNFNSGQGFDYWIEEFDHLNGFFEEAKWEIKWHDNLKTN